MILKTTFTDGLESYIDLGDTYQLIKKATCPTRFNDSVKTVYGQDSDEWAKTIKGFILGENGKLEEPLFDDFGYEIILHNGISFVHLPVM